MNQTIVLNKKNPSRKIKVNREEPNLTMVRYSIPKFDTYEGANLNLLSQMKVHFNLVEKKTGNGYRKDFNLATSVNDHKKVSAGVDVQFQVYDKNHIDEIEISLSGGLDLGLEFQFEFSSYKNFIPLQGPWKEFHEHFSQSDNVNILFSAPFGQGKTTFLNEFFKQNQVAYHVFKIYPVNYSVASNEDIFKYIKVELLFQLLKSGVEFDEMIFKHSEAAPMFVLQNAKSMVSVLLECIPKVGKSVADIYDRLNLFGKKYDEYRNTLNIKDKTGAHNYIKEFYEKEGSLFEDNFYTQLIRQLIVRLKETTGKDIVLVIDDLDRMDPDHIFRIFNVLSAHYDTPEYISESSNKFGFDKIVLVCDYENLNRIFAHRYGPKTHFEGYINKYYSKTVFRYDNKKAIKYLIDIIEKTHGKDSHLISLLVIVMRDLLATNNLTLREILKWYKTWIYHENTDPRALIRFDSNGMIKYKNDRKYTRFLSFYLIHLLESIGDIHTLKQKFTNCQLAIQSNNFRINNVDINKIASSLVAPLVKDAEVAPRRDYNIEFKSRNARVSLELMSDNFDHTYLAFVIFEYEKDRPILLYQNDMYELLALNVNKYIELGGLSDIG